VIARGISGLVRAIEMLAFSRYKRTRFYPKAVAYLVLGTCNPRPTLAAYASE
jgi:hypothetical protein